MLARVYSATILGVDGVEVEIQVNTSTRGDPAVTIVGLPDAAVRESSHRVWTALWNSGFTPHLGKTTVNLAPADLKKQGPVFDLPIAIGMLAAASSQPLERLEHCLIAGELGLNGVVRPIRGALPIALEAKKRGRLAVIMPLANAAETAVIEGIKTFGVSNLREAFEFLRRDRDIAAANPPELNGSVSHNELDFSEVKGQASLRRAVEIAAAGNHNLLFIGSPGSGKSMVAKRIPTILPDMTLQESLEVTKIHSIAGVLREGEGLVMQRPFRAPHHTISDVGLLGGSSNPSPGEISLAHRGILFLDELPEFRRSTLEVLRQPLEDGRVVITRAAGTVVFPSDFMLVAAMNPCRCGYFADPKRECRCSPVEVERYRNRISGPLLDRIDLHVEAPSLSYADLMNPEPGECSAAIRERVRKARDAQLRRFAALPHAASNGRMPHSLIKQHCALDSKSETALGDAMNALQLSARAYHRILKVARTIADLAGSEDIRAPHILEAIGYRSLDRQIWR